MAKKFFTDVFTEKEANVILFGAPTGVYGKDSLQAIRDTSWFVEPFDADRKINLLENVKLADVGNLKLKKMEEIGNKVKEIVTQAKIPLMLSYSHLSTFYALQQLGNVKLIVFDAHADMKDEYIDEKIKRLGKNVSSVVNGATWLRRYCEVKNPKDVVLLGLRSFDYDDLEFMRNKGIMYFTSNQIRQGLLDVRNVLEQYIQNSTVYISVDIDVFDPSIAPAVDYPEPSGIQFNDFSMLVQILKNRIIGMDFCCLKPIKGNQVTEFLAIKVIFELLSLIK